MLKLTEYIIEKLKLDNFTKTNDDLVNTFVALITDIANIKLDYKENKEILDAIEDWVRTFDLSDQMKQLKCYFDYRLEKEEEQRLRKNDLMKFVTRDEDAEFLKNYSDKAYSTKPIVKKGNNTESVEIYLYDKYLIYLKRRSFNKISNDYIFYIDENI